MKKLLFIFFLFTIYQQTKAQELKRNTQKGTLQIDYMAVNMPTNLGKPEKNMGLAGVHYNLDFNHFYTGIGIYGSVNGIRGGFFTLGVNAGYKYSFLDNFFIDTGIHFGGGGGASAPDGGGAFILPHVNLGYQFKPFSIAGGWSYINFFDNGNIKSNQFNIVIKVPLNFNYSTFSNKQKNWTIATVKNDQWKLLKKPLSLTVHLNNLKVKGNSQFTNGTNISGRTIRMAGFELNTYLTKNIFFFIKADGAYKGIPAGYMDVLIGSGYQFWMNNNNTNILAKLGVGASGGGGVNTQGGFLVSPDFSIEQKLYKNIFMAANLGYTIQPSGTFKALNYGVGLKYYLNKEEMPTKEFTTLNFKGFEAIIKEDFYPNAQRVTGIKKDMYQISMQINFFLNNYIYAAGQASFANFGDAGAYAEGIVGLGIQSKPLLNKKATIFGQLLAGSGGGGGISTGEGLIIKPSIGLKYALSNTLNLQVATGYVKASGGGLNNPFMNLGISYAFSFLNKK